MNKYDFTDIDIVVAKYKESIDWLDFFITNGSKIYLYDKSDQEISDQNISDQNILEYINKGNIIYEKLPNVGRESHTYLYHILKHRDSLNEYTIFTQANPFDHIVKGGKSNINDFYNHIVSFINSNNSFQGFGYKNYSLLIGLGGKRNDIIREIYKFLFGGELDVTIKFRNGGIFATAKEVILNRSSKFYKRCMNTELSKRVNPHCGFCFERLWQIIFNPDYKAII